MRVSRDMMTFGNFPRFDPSEVKEIEWPIRILDRFEALGFEHFDGVVYPTTLMDMAENGEFEDLLHMVYVEYKGKAGILVALSLRGSKMGAFFAKPLDAVAFVAEVANSPKLLKELDNHCRKAAARYGEHRRARSAAANKPVDEIEVQGCLQAC